MTVPENFKFACPACGQRILAASDWTGREIRCPACAQSITVPNPAQSPAPPVPEASSARPRPTMRIDLTPSPPANPAGSNGRPAQPVAAPVPNPKQGGQETWAELVQRLESGAHVEPAALATVLFRELMEVRQRLDEVEQQLAESRRTQRPNVGGRDPAADPKV